MEAVRVLLATDKYNLEALKKGVVTLNVPFDCLEEKYFVVVGYNGPHYFLIVDKFMVHPARSHGERVEAHLKYFAFVGGNDVAIKLFGSFIHEKIKVSVDVVEVIKAIGEADFDQKDLAAFDPLTAAEAKRRVSLMYGVPIDKVKISIEY